MINSFNVHGKFSQGAAKFSLLNFWVWALCSWHILLLACTPRNIMCILEPWDRIAARIPWVLEGRQFFAAEISGVGTACLPDIIVEMYSRECNVHCRAMASSSDSQCIQGAGSFSLWSFRGVGTVWLAHIIVGMHTHEYIMYFRTIRWWPAAPNPMGTWVEASFRDEISGGGHCLPAWYYCWNVPPGI